MDNVEKNAADLASNPPAAQPPTRFFKLPDFWTASPTAWFGVAEAQFLLRGTTTQREHFALAAVLPEASARRVAHILAAPGNNCYTELRAALLVGHQLTAFRQSPWGTACFIIGTDSPNLFESEFCENPNDALL